MAVTDAKAPKIPLLCPQGKSFVRVIRLKTADPNDPLVSIPWDLTGYTARCEVRSKLPSESSVPGDGDVLLTLTTENGGIEIVPVDGKVSLFIDPVTTASFDLGTYFWELELVSSSGFVPYFMTPSKFKVVSENTLTGDTI